MRRPPSMLGRGCVDALLTWPYVRAPVGCKTQCTNQIQGSLPDGISPPPLPATFHLLDVRGGPLKDSRIMRQSKIFCDLIDCCREKILPHPTQQLHVVDADVVSPAYSVKCRCSQTASGSGVSSAWASSATEIIGVQSDDEPTTTTTGPTDVSVSADARVCLCSTFAVLFFLVSTHRMATARCNALTTPPAPCVSAGSRAGRARTSAREWPGGARALRRGGRRRPRRAGCCWRR